MARGQAAHPGGQTANMVRDDRRRQGAHGDQGVCGAWGFLQWLETHRVEIRTAQRYMRLHEAGLSAEDIGLVGGVTEALKYDNLSLLRRYRALKEQRAELEGELDSLRAREAELREAHPPDPAREAQFEELWRSLRTVEQGRDAAMEAYSEEKNRGNVLQRKIRECEERMQTRR